MLTPQLAESTRAARLRTDGSGRANEHEETGAQIGGSVRAVTPQDVDVFGVLAVVLAFGAVLSATVYLAQSAAERAAALQTRLTDDQWFKDHRDQLTLEKDILQAETDNEFKAVTLAVQGIGAITLAIGGYFAWRNLRATLAKLDIDHEAQITNRFTQAIGQLGADNKEGAPILEVRLRGIYALERIAADSPRDHWSIVEILTAYVRKNAPVIRLPQEADAPHMPADGPLAILECGCRSLSAASSG
jgi:hypothetical protein